MTWSAGTETFAVIILILTILTLLVNVVMIVCFIRSMARADRLWRTMMDANLDNFETAMANLSEKHKWKSAAQTLANQTDGWFEYLEEKGLSDDYVVWRSKNNDRIPALIKEILEKEK